MSDVAPSEFSATGYSIIAGCSSAGLPNGDAGATASTDCESSGEDLTGVGDETVGSASSQFEPSTLSSFFLNKRQRTNALCIRVKKDKENNHQ